MCCDLQFLPFWSRNCRIIQYFFFDVVAFYFASLFFCFPFFAQLYNSQNTLIMKAHLIQTYFDMNTYMKKKHTLSRIINEQFKSLFF